MRYAAKKTLGRLLIAHEIMKPSTNLALSSDFISGSSMAPARRGDGGGGVALGASQAKFGSNE